MRKVNRDKLKFAAIAGIGLAAAASFGSGFAIVEQSVKGVGTAMAGTGVQSSDASFQFYNPASISDMSAKEINAGFHFIIPNTEFKNEGSNYPAAGGMPLQGGDGGNGGETAMVPNLYYAQPIADSAWSFGLGINAPYGLETDYDDGWYGRYHALNTALSMLNFNPVLSYNVNDKLALAAGASAYYADVSMSSAVDFGSIGYAYGLPGAMPQMLDGEVELQGDDWSPGFNLGLLFRPTEESRISLAYRSAMDFDIEGDADFDTPAQAAALQSMGLFVDSDASAEMKLPSTISLGGSYKINEKWELLGDITWTEWSRFEELRVVYDSMQPDSVTVENWKDTWRASIGANYLLNEQWTLRAGTCFDESPIVSADYRTPRIPGNDRIWLSMGATVAIDEAWSIDCAYVHLFVEDANISGVGSTGDYLNGYFEGKVDILSLAANYRF